MDFLGWAKSIHLDFATVISLIALFLSVLSYVFNRRSWHETYRPIVVAEMVYASKGACEVHFDVIIKNIGNRPAFNVQLKIDKKLPSITTDQIESHFFSGRELPLFNPGEMKFINFTKENKNDILPQIILSIKYKDQSGRKIKSKQGISVNPPEWKNTSNIVKYFGQ